MLKIFIQGLKDGEYDVELSSPVEKIPDIFEEFFGNVEFKGKLRIIGRRYTVTGKASCNIKLTCDLTLSDFNELIETDIKVAFRSVDNNLSHVNDKMEKEINEYFISDDEKYLDLNKEIREELEVNIPMKRIAPEFRGKTFEDIFPEFSNEKKETKRKSSPDEIDDRWAPLKNLKLKKN